MDNINIDRELEHYYRDRLTTSGREAFRRFYLRAVSRFNGPELEKYLKRAGSQAAAYAKLSHMLRSPVPHMETPLLLSSIVLVVAGLVMVANGERSVIVAGATSAAIVGMLVCVKKLLLYWRKYSVRETVFLELHERLFQEIAL